MEVKVCIKISFAEAVVRIRTGFTWVKVRIWNWFYWDESVALALCWANFNGLNTGIWDNTMARWQCYPPQIFMIPDCFACSPCGFFWILQFPRTFQNMPVGGSECAKLHLGVNCVCTWCPAMDWHPVHGVFPPHAQCSWNKHHIHSDPEPRMNNA